MPNDHYAFSLLFTLVKPSWCMDLSHILTERVEQRKVKLDAGGRRVPVGTRDIDKAKPRLLPAEGCRH